MKSIIYNGFKIFFDPLEKEYRAVNQHNNELLIDNDLELLKNRINNYKNELENYFANLIKNSGLRK